MTVQISCLHARGISDLPMGNGPGLQQPMAHDGHSTHKGTVYVKRFCGPVFVLVDISYVSQHFPLHVCGRE